MTPAALKRYRTSSKGKATEALLRIAEGEGQAEAALRIGISVRIVVSEETIRFLRNCEF